MRKGQLARDCEKVSSYRHVRAHTDRPMNGDRGTIISTVSWCLLGALSRSHSGPQRLIRDPRPGGPCFVHRLTIKLYNEIIQHASRRGARAASRLNPMDAYPIRVWSRTLGICAHRSGSRRRRGGLGLLDRNLSDPWPCLCLRAGVTSFRGGVALSLLFPINCLSTYSLQNQVVELWAVAL